MKSRHQGPDSILRIYEAMQIPQYDAELQARLIERHCDEVFPKAETLLDDYALVSSSLVRRLPGLVYYRVDEAIQVSEVPPVEEITTGEELTSEEETAEQETGPKIEITHEEKLTALLTLSQARCLTDAKRGYGPIRLLVFVLNSSGEWEEFPLFTMRNDGMSGMHNLEGVLCGTKQTNEVLTLFTRMSADLKAGHTIPITPLD